MNQLLTIARIGKGGFYGEVKEELPPKMLKPWGQRVLSFTFRMLQSFDTVKDRTWWRLLLL
jgi:hypothetical protein